MVRRSIQKILESPLLDAFFRVIVVVAVLIGGFASAKAIEVGRRNRELTQQTKDLAQCVASYNNANNARSKALVDATDEERAAERKADDAQAALFLSPIVAKPAAQRTTAEQTELLRLFHAYQDALSDQKKERATADDARGDHPIPAPPSAVCD